MLRYTNIKQISLQDWDNLVKETYGKPYSFQQQDGCQERGSFEITIPSEETVDEEYHDKDDMSEGDMGVKFFQWQTTAAEDYDRLYWFRNYYPDINTLANDLYNKGLIEAGDYVIKIDW